MFVVIFFVMQEFSFCFVMPQVLRVVRQSLEAILGQTCSVSFSVSADLFPHHFLAQTVHI